MNAQLAAAERAYSRIRDLRRAGQADSVVLACDRLIGAFGEDDDLNVQETVAEAMALKREALVTQGFHEEALTVDDELVRRYAVATEPRLRYLVSFALLDKVWWALDAGKTAAAVAASEELMTRLESETSADLILGDGRLALKVAGKFAAMSVSARLRLTSRGDARIRAEHGLSLLGRLKTSFEQSSVAEHRKLAAEAQLMTARLLARRGRIRDAVAAYDAVVDLGEPAVAALDEIIKNKDDIGSHATEQVAWAMAAKAAALEGLGHTRDAIGVLTDLIQTFERSKSAIVTVVVAKSRAERRRLLGTN